MPSSLPVLSDTRLPVNFNPTTGGKLEAPLAIIRTLLIFASEPSPIAATFQRPLASTGVFLTRRKFYSFKVQSQLSLHGNKGACIEAHSVRQQ